MCKICHSAIDETINQNINLSIHPYNYQSIQLSVHIYPSILHRLTLTALLSRMYPAPVQTDRNTIVNINTEIDVDKHRYDDQQSVICFYSLPLSIKGYHDFMMVVVVEKDNDDDGRNIDSATDGVYY